MAAPSPTSMPKGLMRNTWPFDSSRPSSNDGSLVTTRFSTLESLEGCMNRVISSGAMEKVCQSMTLRWVPVVIVRMLSSWSMVAWPRTTLPPLGLAMATEHASAWQTARAMQERRSTWWRRCLIISPLEQHVDGEVRLDVTTPFRSRRVLDDYAGHVQRQRSPPAQFPTQARAGAGHGDLAHLHGGDNVVITTRGAVQEQHASQHAGQSCRHREGRRVQLEIHGHTEVSGQRPLVESARRSAARETDLLGRNERPGGILEMQRGTELPKPERPEM